MWLLLAAGGCGGSDVGGPDIEDVSAAPPPIDLQNGSRTFRLDQRNTAALPGSSERVFLTIDDVTRGQVMASLASADGRTLAARRSMREASEMVFELDGHRYRLRLDELINRLVGDDTAVFTLRSADSMPEVEKIRALIAAIESSEGLTFIRNDKEYTGGEAADHLRRKWDYARDEIATAEQFIEHLASESSMTGQPYRIRFSDGYEVTSEQWLRERLDDLEKDSE